MSDSVRKTPQRVNIDVFYLGLRSISFKINVTRFKKLLETIIPLANKVITYYNTEHFVVFCTHKSAVKRVGGRSELLSWTEYCHVSVLRIVQ